jgi:hypothetical protein
MSRLRGQFGELLVLPAAACLLPWSWVYRLARQLSRAPWLYREVTNQAQAAATATGLFKTDNVWRRHYRLNKLVDGTDPWLSRFRRDRWMDRHLDVVGDWPDDRPFLATSLHWGTGMWALRHIRSHAGPVSMVLRPVREWGAAFSSPMRFYLESYEKEITRAGGATITPTGPGLTARVSSLFEQGRNLLVLLDVPKGENKDGFAVDFLGQPTYFATGIVNMAVQQQRAIVPYSIGLDFATGRRRLEIQAAIEVDDTSQAMKQLAAYFDAVVRRQSPGWHFWPLHKAFLSPEFKM